jgi:hypothetical protein
MRLRKKASEEKTETLPAFGKTLNQKDESINNQGKELTTETKDNLRKFTSASLK